MLPTDITLYTNSRIESYREKVSSVLTRYLSDMKTDQIKEHIDKLVEEIDATKSILSTSTVNIGDKFTSENYNTAMKSIAIDLSTIYEELDKMVVLFNQLIKAIEISDKQMADQINKGFTRIRSLEQIKSSSKTFDNIEYETFVTQSNTYVGRSAATIPQDAGLLRMATDKVNPVYVESNDADIIPVILNNNLSVYDYTKGNPSSNNSFESIYLELFSQEKTNVSITVGSKMTNKLDYTGAVVAYFITLPSTRQLNNLFFKPYGDAEFDILGLYTSELVVSNVYDSSLIKIETQYDTYNYNSYEFNFKPITARTIILIIGQSHFSNIDISIPKFGFPDRNKLIEGSAVNLTQTEKLAKLTQLLNNLYSYTSNNRTDKQLNSLLADYGFGFNFSGLSTKIQRLVGSIGKLLKNDDSLITVNGFLYKVGLYSLSINMNEYMVDSYFTSMPYNSNVNNLLSIQLSTSSYNKEDNNLIADLMYDVIINGLSFPIMPVEIGPNVYNNRIIHQDSFTVVNIFNKVYNTRFLADSTLPIQVYLNGIQTNNFQKKYLSNNVIYGIQIDDVINPGEIVSIKYTIPLLDHNGDAYEPYSFIIDKKIDPPHIINPSLYYSKTDRILIGSGTIFVPYELDKLQQTSSPNNPSGICWFIKSSDFKQGTPMDILYPSGFVSVSDTGYIFRQTELSIPYSHRYFAGIYNEPINSDMKTSYEYIPGSLSLVIDNNIVEIEEYRDGEPLNQYHLDFQQLQQPGLLSYCPIDQKKCLSNIKDHNQIEYFESTKEKTIELKSSVYIDNNIINDIGRLWIYDDGVFVLEKNSKIIYEPIKVRVGNKFAINKTNYLSPDSPGSNLEQYDTKYNNIQYYHNGNKLIFNTDIINTIEIYYYRSVSEIKLGITMINSDKINNFITPEIYEYAIMFDYT